MTASSVELFPCRVKLIGLPQHSLGNGGAAAAAAATTTAIMSRPTRPPLAAKQRVSRNLFGATEPGEIDQLLNEETQRKRNYFLQRYNFDLQTDQNRIEIPTTTSLPSLIEKESKQYEKRLEQTKEKCNTSTSVISQPQQSSFKRKYSVNSSSDEEEEESSVSSSSSSEKINKNCSRQILLTDCYSVRKSINSLPLKRRFEVELMSKPIRAAATATCITSTTTTTITADCADSNSDATTLPPSTQKIDVGDKILSREVEVTSTSSTALLKSSVKL